MLSPHERADVAGRFGVSELQVERDYLISLVLAQLSKSFADAVVFIGGTALARTHLPDGRLSEDIDLVAVGDRNKVADALDRALPSSVLREYGRLTWRPSLSEVRESDSAFLVGDDATSLKVQLLSGIGRPRWPLEQRSLVQRYSDAPPATLNVLNRPAFVAAKAVAWCDRAAPRDLWDLWALAKIGAIEDVAAQLFRQFGPTNKPPSGEQFVNAPTAAEWHAQLAGQTRLDVTAHEALSVVRASWVAL